MVVIGRISKRRLPESSQCRTARNSSPLSSTVPLRECCMAGVRWTGIILVRSNTSAQTTFQLRFLRVTLLMKVPARLTEVYPPPRPTGLPVLPILSCKWYCIHHASVDSPRPPQQYDLYYRNPALRYSSTRKASPSAPSADLPLLILHSAFIRGRHLDDDDDRDENDD